MKTKPQVFWLFIFLSFGSALFSSTLTKEEEDGCKRDGYSLSNMWRSCGNGFMIVATLEGPTGFTHPIIVFDLYVDRPFPSKMGVSYEVKDFALVSIGSKSGLCKIQPHSTDLSKIQSFSCDGNTINFKWGSFDVHIFKGEECFGDHKCHVLFSLKSWDEIHKKWVEKTWKSVDGIKLGEVILR